VVQLVKASGGVFEISVDNELMYSKKATGVFPRDEDIVKALKTR
jgi:selenoprotein W-related protein